MPSTKEDAKYTKKGQNAVNNFSRFVDDPNSKWVKYGARIVNEVDEGVLTTLAANLAYEAGYRGLGKARKLRDEYHTNFPWVLLMDPTSACNLRCTGCWAAEYGHKLNLSYELMDSIIEQGKKLGIYFYLYTGGEPLVRKDDIIKLCKKHSDCEFMMNSPDIWKTVAGHSSDDGWLCRLCIVFQTFTVLSYNQQATLCFASISMKWGMCDLQYGFFFGHRS